MNDISGLPPLRSVRYHAEFAVTSSRFGPVTVRVLGELDAASSPAFLRRTRRLLAPGSRLVVDVTGLEFCGVAGMSALAELADTARQSGVLLRVEVGGTLRRHLHTVGLADRIPLGLTATPAA